MTSPRKAQANRANALRSTGPRSAVGRKISAANSKKHGLSVAMPPDLLGPKVQSVAALIGQDGIDEHTARDLASRIVDYERNLAHERQTFADSVDMPESSAEVSSEDVQRAGLEHESNLINEALLMPGDAKVDRELLRLHGQIKRFIARTKVKFAKQHALTFERYYRRSANQLLKSLKAVR